MIAAMCAEPIWAAALVVISGTWAAVTAAYYWRKLK